MSERWERMERCLQSPTPLAEVIGALQDADWRVRFAAVVALGDRRDARGLEPLLELLRTEDAAPLYTQSNDLGDVPAETRAAWERRGRLKQAVSFALADIGVADPRALEFLHRYATDQREDYAVRAGAARALGRLRDPSSRSILEAAARDTEWCTKTEARKALAFDTKK